MRGAPEGRPRLTPTQQAGFTGRVLHRGAENSIMAAVRWIRVQSVGGRGLMGAREQQHRQPAAAVQRSKSSASMVGAQHNWMGTKAESRGWKDPGRRPPCGGRRHEGCGGWVLPCCTLLLAPPSSGCSLQLRAQLRARAGGLWLAHVARLQHHQWPRAAAGGAGGRSVVDVGAGRSAGQERRGTGSGKRSAAHAHACHASPQSLA